MSFEYHFPPDLLDLLVDTMPRLVRGKEDLLDVFTACGVPDSDIGDLRQQVRARAEISKYKIARETLKRLNEAGDSRLSQRRRIVQRVCDWQDFSTCWPNEELKAKGLVTEVQSIVGTKDAFTRMADERDAESKRVRSQQEARANAQRAHREAGEALRQQLYALFAPSTDPAARGLLFERAVNRLFEHAGVLIRDSFRRTGDEREGVIEQIDGVVEIDGSIYLVEVKWHKERLGKLDLASHLVNVMNRSAARGMVISVSGFGPPAVAVCRESLSQLTTVLIEFKDIVGCLDADGDLLGLLKERIRIAIVERQPLATTH